MQSSIHDPLRVAQFQLDRSVGHYVCVYLLYIYECVMYRVKMCLCCKNNNLAIFVYYTRFEIGNHSTIVVTMIRNIRRSHSNKCLAIV